MNTGETQDVTLELASRGCNTTALANSPSPDDTPPSHAVNIAPRWNQSRRTIWQVTAACLCALVMGANDAAYGAIIPYVRQALSAPAKPRRATNAVPTAQLELYYHQSYTIISLVFLSPFVGYTIAAFGLSHAIHQHFGRRGIAVVGPACHLMTFIVLSVHPPSLGLQNAAWNVWIGNMANSNEVLGFFHGFFGVGATISPLAATSLITKAGWEWFDFYHLMSSLYATAAFWPETGVKFRDENPSSSRGGALPQTRLSLTYKATWICATFLFLYGGVEVGIGGWIVVFMTDVRHGGTFASGMTETGFWLGVTVGRFVLGFVSPRVGEKLSIALYIVLAIVMELLFWLVPQFIVSAVAVSLVGFFLGTIFPCVVVVATRILPKDIHVAAIGFAAAFSMGGAAVFPFLIGAIAQAEGGEYFAAHSAGDACGGAGDLGDFDEGSDGRASASGLRCL
ncbi:hypothetical protein N7468_000222 [Penicillium chermesinum]|uniref:Major facilitator superfamily (MFS) profile domain-containing protein n=1 Tax=Penicillium chermesinum TaxID=63820 RepID=A0A9W9PJX9_9EURO|nr:uncharacterized protein N7468_000222 [Penicillium chermesinum]KAJ5248771.1 hypothetical protein N7468_000222 [Penicillium chermesinum]